MIDSAYAHDVAQERFLLADLHLANLAHAVMLAEQKIVPLEESKILLPELISLVEDGGEIDLDPKYGDLYNCVDVFLKNKIGHTAGWLHAGRPRREAVNVSFLLRSRREFLQSCLQLKEVGEALLEQARKHRCTVMSDYTYLHHAQPTTLGHYLMTFLLPIIRDLSRWKEAFKTLNSSPAGSGSVNGSRLPLDKPLLANLLGFESISIHCRDAMWQPDVPLQTVSVLSTSLTNISRVCEEWMVWNSSEFGMIELPDEFCRASVIMPQKKNPYPLAYIRGLSAQISGLFGEYSSLGKVASGFPDSRTFVYDSLIETIIKTTKAYEMFAELVRKVNFNTDRMRQIAETSMGFATDFADYLLLNARCDYRTAHTTTGQIIKFLLEQNLQPKDLSIEDLRGILNENLGKEFDMSDQDLQNILSADNIVASRVTQGSASQQEIGAMLDENSDKLTAFSEWIERMHQAEQKFPEDLKDAALAIINKKST